MIPLLIPHYDNTLKIFYLTGIIKNIILSILQEAGRFHSSCWYGHPLAARCAGCLLCRWLWKYHDNAEHRKRFQGRLAIESQQHLATKSSPPPQKNGRPANSRAVAIILLLFHACNFPHVGRQSAKRAFFKEISSLLELFVQLTRIGRNKLRTVRAIYFIILKYIDYFYDKMSL